MIMKFFAESCFISSKLARGISKTNDSNVAVTFSGSLRTRRTQAKILTPTLKMFSSCFFHHLTNWRNYTKIFCKCSKSTIKIAPWMRLCWSSIGKADLNDCLIGAEGNRVREWHKKYCCIRGPKTQSFWWNYVDPLKKFPSCSFSLGNCRN